MFRIRSVVPALGVLAVTLVASAGSLRFQSDGENPAPALTFFVKGPVGFDINGKFSGLKVADDGTKITFSAPLNTISTGIEKRDNHAKETLEVNKFPTVTVTVTKASLKFPADGKELTAKAQAEVKLHGVTKSVPLTYTVKRKGSVYKVDGGLTLAGVWGTDDNPKAGFAMKKPCFAMVCVKDDVKITAKFSVKDD
jgi:hypothetical protein